MSLLWSSLLLFGGGENRLWFVDLEVRGPCQELRIDCGPDGETRLLSPFSSGDERRLSLPVPVRSPLGIEGLASLPLPHAQPWPSTESGTVRILGWSARQPSERLRRAFPQALARVRPPVLEDPPRAAWAELCLALVAGGLVLSARRRPWRALGIGLGAGGLVLGLASGRVGRSWSEPLLDWEAGEPLALASVSARGSLPLPREWLEVMPEGLRLEFELRSPEAGVARAGGAWLTGLEALGTPLLRVTENDGESLASVWTREADGRWHGRGPWEHGRALGPWIAAAPTPPGWATGGLPPGRSILLGRSAAGGWVRCLGFDPDPGPTGD